MLRVSSAVLAFLLTAACSVHADRPPDSALERGCQYLWSQQAADGGWHSRTYGLLKSGQSLTPFVLNTLLQACPVPAGGVDRAIAFIKRNTNSEGAVGKMDPLLYDYPNYATALAVQALVRAGRPVAHMTAWLRTQQLSEEHGWKRDDAGLRRLGHGRRAARSSQSRSRGLVDDPPRAASARRRRSSGERSGMGARAVFVERCQNPDGGFYFSTVVLDANKAGQDANARYRSYGTATADGILALLALGVQPERARAWLAAHDRPDGAPGFTGEAYQRWTLGLRFYYAAASAEVLGASPLLVSSLESAQHADGSWRNAEKLVKEDDPLIATAFAVSALARAKLE